MNWNIILNALHVGGSVTDVERTAMRDSVIHSLYGRFKLITLLIIVILL